MGGGPALGQERGELVHGRGGDAGEDITQVGERLDAVALAGGEEAEEDGGGGPAVVGAAEQPDGMTFSG